MLCMQSQPVSKSKKTEYDIFFQIVKELENSHSSRRMNPKPQCLQLGIQSSLRGTTTLNPGGGERDRTDDPLLAKQVLSQLSYTPR